MRMPNVLKMWIETEKLYLIIINKNFKFEAIVDKTGSIRLLEPVKLP